MQGYLSSLGSRVCVGIKHRRALTFLLGYWGTQVKDNGTGSQKTALMGAAANGHLEIVRLLLAAGAKMDARDFSGKTALNLGGPVVPFIHFFLVSGFPYKVTNPEKGCP